MSSARWIGILQQPEPLLGPPGERVRAAEGGGDEREQERDVGQPGDHEPSLQRPDRALMVPAEVAHHAGPRVGDDQAVRVILRLGDGRRLLRERAGLLRLPAFRGAERQPDAGQHRRQAGQSRTAGA